MLLLYRIIIWLLLLVAAAGAASIIPLPLGEANSTWLGQFLYYLAGYVGFEIIWYIQKREQLRVPSHIFLWLIVAMLHGMPGIMYGLFTQYGWYDQVAHCLLMGTMLAYIVHQYVGGFFQKLSITQPSLALILVVSVTATLGVLNELMEYALDVLHDTQMVDAIVGDTANDLLMNTVGTTLYVVIAFASGAFSKRVSAAVSR